MYEKNDAVTEKDVFLYIRSHPGCKKPDIIDGLRTNGWQVSHKLGKMVRSSILIESGSGKARVYRVSAEFKNVEPTFKNEPKRRELRYVPRYKAVVEVYKRMLAGEALDSIDASDEIKSTIRLFEKYKSRSAYQICEITGIHVTLAADLRHLNRVKLRKFSKKSFACVPSVGWTIRQMSLGTPLQAIREQVTDETLSKAITFIKMANSGSNEFEIGRAIGVESHRVRQILKSFKSIYAKSLVNFEPERYLVKSDSVKVIL